jgi:excisionase family DNA binding protein
MKAIQEITPGSITPDELARLALMAAEGSGENHRPASLVEANGTTYQLPEPIYQFMVSTIEYMISGSGVALVPVDTYLTTSQVASLLNVSRPHVVKLLESGEIPFRKAGTHRRVLLADALQYRHQQQARFDAALREMRDIARRLNLPE